MCMTRICDVKHHIRTRHSQPRPGRVLSGRASTSACILGLQVQRLLEVLHQLLPLNSFQGQQGQSRRSAVSVQFVEHIL